MRARPKETVSPSRPDRPALRPGQADAVWDSAARGTPPAQAVQQIDRGLLELERDLEERTKASRVRGWKISTAIAPGSARGIGPAPGLINAGLVCIHVTTDNDVWQDRLVPVT
jgi:hypothetical protein